MNVVLAKQQTISVGIRVVLSTTSARSLWLGGAGYRYVASDERPAAGNGVTYFRPQFSHQTDQKLTSRADQQRVAIYSGVN